jgi:hypothetical protein
LERYALAIETMLVTPGIVVWICRLVVAASARSPAWHIGIRRDPNLLWPSLFATNLLGPDLRWLGAGIGARFRSEIASAIPRIRCQCRRRCPKDDRVEITGAAARLAAVDPAIGVKSRCQDELPFSTRMSMSAGDVPTARSDDP